MNKYIFELLKVTDPLTDSVIIHTGDVSIFANIITLYFSTLCHDNDIV